MKKATLKPYNGGKWSIAKMRSFAMSAIRRAQWPAKYASIAKAYVRDGINPKTGKPCKLHQCPVCKQLFPKGKIVADHINPVIPVKHDWNESPTSFLGYDWNEVMRRLWVEQEGFQPICKQCHKEKTRKENKNRTKGI